MIALAIFLAVFIAFVFVFLYFWGINPGDVTIYLTSDQSLTQPIPIMIVGAIMAGLVIGYGFHMLSLLAHGVHHWRFNRKDKKGRETTSIYREGVGRLLSGDIKKAKALLQKALDRDPSRIETYIALASAHLQEGASQEAVNLLRKARDIEPRNLEVLFKLASTYEETNYHEEARQAYKEILAVEKDNRKAIRTLRDLHIRHERWQEALDLQKRLLKAGPSSERLEEEKKKQLYLRYEVARKALGEGQTDQAKAEFKEIIKQAPDFTPARVSLGDAYQSQKRPDEADRVWQEGYQDLGRSVFLSRLEDLYMEAEDPTTLLSFYRSAILEREDDLMLRLFFGKLCLRLEMVDEALEQLYAVENAGVDTPHLHLLLAEAHRRRSRIDEAIGEYKKALGVDSRISLGYVCDTCGESSVEWLSRCPECGTWGSFSRADRQLIRNARPVEARAIYHGERH
jgi:lipopolysaccharide biosynthesis regulator YciM